MHTTSHLPLVACTRFEDVAGLDTRSSTDETEPGRSLEFRC